MPTQTNEVPVKYKLSEDSLGTTVLQGTQNTINQNISVGNVSGVFGGLWVLGIAICVVAAMGVYAYAGVRYQNVDSGSKEAEIKDNIKRATLGLLGVLGLWLLLNQINPELLRGEISLPRANTPSSSQTTSPTTQPQTPKPTDPGQSSSEASVRSALAAIPVDINNAGKTCSNGQTSGCTNVAGMPQATIEMLTKLRAACPSCYIQITGGTEPGHKSHGEGMLPVDLNLSDTLTPFIRRTGTPVGPASFCLVEYSYLGWRFCDEKNTARHWHVYQ
jgi:hypothetical protein